MTVILIPPRKPFKVVCKTFSQRLKDAEIAKRRWAAEDLLMDAEYDEAILGDLIPIGWESDGRVRLKAIV